MDWIQYVKLSKLNLNGQCLLLFDLTKKTKLDFKKMKYSKKN